MLIKQQVSVSDLRMPVLAICLMCADINASRGNHDEQIFSKILAIVA